MPSLQLKHVYKRYPGGKKAVKDFSIDVPKKEFITVVGPSGCGKTTLLRMIAGLEKVTQGEIFIDGKKVNDVKPCDRSVSLAFQNYALFPYMTAFQNIALGLKIGGVDKREIEYKVREAAKLLGIENELNYKPKELSGGQRQRIALGRAMVTRPKFFLLDEPLASLDVKLRSEIRRLIVELYDKSDATFIYVTHDQMEAMTMGERLVVMNDGIAEQIDAPRSIYNDPINKFVAGFIGSPEMNFIDGSIKREGNLTVLTFCGKKFELNNCKLTDRNVTVGLRAEDIIISDSGRIEATVKDVEFLGKEQIVYARSGEFDLTIKTVSNVNKGDKILLDFDITKLRLFDQKDPYMKL